MKIGIIVYQDLTLLDLVGFTDAVQRLRTMQFVPDLEITYCAPDTAVSDNYGFPVRVDKVKPDLSGYDLIFIPGGFGSRQMIHEASFTEWISTAEENTLKTSICTGSLILGASGLLEGRRATTHFDEFDLLHQFTKTVVKADIVEDGDTITGGAVGTSITLGLHICKKLAGKEAAIKIAQRMGLPHIYEQANVQIY